MTRPPLGLCLPVKVVRVRDGDTVEVTAVTGAVWAIRQIGLYCHETRTGPDGLRAMGLDAKHFAQECLDDSEQVYVYVPATEDVRAIVEQGGGANLMRVATMDRILGHVFLDDDTTLADVMVRAGHGYRTKREQDDAGALNDTTRSKRAGDGR